MLDYSFHEWIIQSTNGINMPLTNSLVRLRRERLTGFDCNCSWIDQLVYIIGSVSDFSIPVHQALEQRLLLSC